jgi:nucleotide-binding universal stress UspA family protein
MSEIKDVIVYVDFDECELKVVAYAAKLAKILGAEVTLMHVLHTGYDYLEVGGYGKSIEVAYERALLKARRIMDDYIREIKKVFPVEIKKKLATGHPIDEFINFVNARKGLPVLPNHVKSHKVRFVSPKIIHKAIRKLNTNMVFVDGEFLPRIDKINIEKILVPVDFSEYSKSALKFATKLGGEVHAITVVHPPRVSRDLLEEVELNYDEFISALEMEAKRKLDNLVKEINGTNILTEVVEGDPPERILEISREKFDLIVMGIKGRSESEKLMVGSVTEQVVEYSEVPVAVIRSF